MIRAFIHTKRLLLSPTAVQLLRQPGYVYGPNGLLGVPGTPVLFLIITKDIEDIIMRVLVAGGAGCLTAEERWQGGIHLSCRTALEEQKIPFADCGRG